MLRSKIEIDDVVSYAAKKYKVKKEDIYHSYKKPLKEKKIVLYVVKRLTGMTNRAIGNVFGLSYSAVSKAYASMAKEIKQNRKISKEIKGVISHFKV